MSKPHQDVVDAVEEVLDLGSQLIHGWCPVGFVSRKGAKAPREQAAKVQVDILSGAKDLVVEAVWS
jgi:hypothetical protein